MSRSRPLSKFGPVINDPQCGQHLGGGRLGSFPPGANRRVLDGQPAGFGSFPWQALIRWVRGGVGGTLVVPGTSRS